MKGEHIEQFIVAIIVALAVFLGTSALKTLRNEERVYAVTQRVENIEEKIDVIYNYIIKKESE